MARIDRVVRMLVVATMMAALVGCAAPAADVSAPDPAESPGAALVDQKCTMCHTTERVYAATYDSGEWTSVVERMERNGLVLADDDKQAVIDFLSDHSANK